jgi:hypothetical protein
MLNKLIFPTVSAQRHTPLNTLTIPVSFEVLCCRILVRTKNARVVMQRVSATTYPHLFELMFRGFVSLPTILAFVFLVTIGALIFPVYTDIIE